MYHECHFVLIFADYDCAYESFPPTDLASYNESIASLAMLNAFTWSPSMIIGIH